jgi:ABC-2 type transport system permease protein
MKPHVIFAIFKRNFLSYFASPTGYVFICVFVVASSWAAFWPSNFFDLNLATLDQLNSKIPWILLMFIPAITMSIWAEERRQGTDELLLTIPAGDFDVVLGKYLAGVAIFSVSLSFSLFCSYFVLLSLAWPEGPDFGLFIATYFGYWLMGLAMLAVGMVASFFTSNLTVAFIMGVLLNVPLVFLNYFDVVLPTDSVNKWMAANLPGNGPKIADFLVPADLADRIKSWSLESQFLDFGRGMLTFGGLVYFSLIVAVMLYLCMVLIGRRHWQGGRAGVSYGFHYLTRFISLAVIGWGLVVIFHRFDARRDITSEQITSLSSSSRALIKELKKPVRIEAYISPEVPESYVQTRLNLISALGEFRALGGSNITLRIHDTEPLSEQAEQAEQQYGITAQPVQSYDRGIEKRENIYMGVAVVSGLEKVVVPFFGKGLPVEYELTRSIATVGQEKRRKLGVLNTDVHLIGGQDEMLVEELRKQYEVVQVSADVPITDNFDVLLAVQPSSLGPEQMEHFIACVQRGQPTAIFEDPFPRFFPVVGTNAPKQPQSQFGFPQGPPPPKGNIAPLWSLLGVQFGADEIVWQDYNPHPKLREFFPPEFVILDPAASSDPDRPVFNPDDPISSGLREVLFPFPGSITEAKVSDLKFEPLISTGPDTGTELVSQMIVRNRLTGQMMINPNLRHVRNKKVYYVLAAHIYGTAKPVKSMSDAQPEPAKSETAPAEKKEAADPAASTDDKEAAKKPAEDKGASDKETSDTPADKKESPKTDSEKTAADKSTPEKSTPEKAKTEKSGTDKKSSDKKAGPAEPQINVVLVADIDALFGGFFQLRLQGANQDIEANLQPDNVTFVLNALDVLAGDKRFVEIRNRRRIHRTLKQIEERTLTARDKASKEREDFFKNFESAISDEQKKLNDQISKIDKRTDIDQDRKDVEKEQVMEVGNQRLDVKRKQLQMKRDKEVRQIERELTLSIRKVQDWYKMWALLLPPILPMLIGVVVFYNRRANEREGVSKSRLRRRTDA